ncbi:MAG TPA: twin-arginine translocation signal domain-containing protein [Desulfobulbus sp.]|nr:twin-arginine translocation signal domain-containing protein [Desulfobulbus sp.]
MTDRRDFLKTSAATAALLALGTAGTTRAGEQPAFSGIVYTRANPGQWAKKVASHAPQVTIDKGRVTIVTRHPMSAAHYIVRHTLVLADGTVVGGTTFSPADRPESTYTLPAGYSGRLYATSFCNRHDFWLTETSV